MRLANELTIVGEVVKISFANANEYESLRTDMVFFTVETFSGKLVKLTTSKNTFNGLGMASVLFVGNIVSVLVEENVAGETYHLDADGEQVEDENTGYFVKDVYNTSRIHMSINGISDNIIDAVTEERKAHANDGKKESKFYTKSVNTTDTSKERINSLITKWENTTGVIKANIADLLTKLGCKYDEATNSWINTNKYDDNDTDTGSGI